MIGSARLGAATVALLVALSMVPAIISVDSMLAEGDDCSPGTFTLVPDSPPALESLQSTQAWKHATGVGVTVAIVDSGIDANNVHFPGVVVGGINLVPDGENAQGLTDLEGHGTAIAGTIAARPIEGSGVYGIAPNSVLLSVRVFRDQGQQSADAGFGPTADRIAQGIRWAAENGADIINVSISDYAESAAMLDAVNFAQASGALVVASAGNRNTTGYTDDSVRYPAGYPGVLGVAATNDLGVVTDDSIHGPQVAVAAPGVNVLTSATGAGDCLYATEEASTSFATGYASGAAALVAEAHPDETPAQWKYRLEASALRVNLDARDDRAGWGMIQPYDAITLVPSSSTRGPESPFADISGSAIQIPDVAVKPRPSTSPFEVTREAMIYVAVSAVSILGVFGVIIVLRRTRRIAREK